MCTVYPCNTLLLILYIFYTYVQMSEVLQNLVQSFYLFFFKDKINVYDMPVLYRYYKNIGFVINLSLWLFYKFLRCVKTEKYLFYFLIYLPLLKYSNT